MKTLIATFIVLLLSIPTAIAGSVEGKGIWCSRGNNSFGYWFYDNQSTEYLIRGHEVFERSNPFKYQEVGTDRIQVTLSKFLDRTTLKLTSGRGNATKIYPCYVVQTLNGLKQILQTIIDKGTAENKL